MRTNSPEEPAANLTPYGWPPRPAARQPNINGLYLLLLILALSGFLVLILLQRPGETESETDVEKWFQEQTADFPWLSITRLALLGVGTTLLLIYGGLRLGGLRPVRQEPRRRVHLTTGAAMKGLIIAFFVSIAIVFIAPFLFINSRLPMIDHVIIVDTLAKLVIVAWLLFMLRREYAATPAEAGLSAGKPLRNLLYGFLTYLAIMPLVFLTAFLWRWLGESLGMEPQIAPQVEWLLNSDSTISIIWVSVSAVIVAPLVEEFFFRGFTYSALRTRLGIMPAMLVSSAYFALIHFDFFTFLPIMVLGMGMAFLYERRQNIIAPAALHFFHNAYTIGTILYLRFWAS